MLSRNRLEAIFAVVIMIVSLLFLNFTRKFPAAIEQMDVGPAALPRMIFVGLIILCILYLIDLYRRSEDQPFAVENVLSILTAFGLLALYVVLTYFLGYVLATFLFVILMLILLRYHRWGINVLFIGGIMIVTYYGFNKAVGIPFPKGILFL
jgi:hypothetical protein